MRLPNLLASRRGRFTAFFLLYVTEGIPLGFAAVAVATQLRRMGGGPAEIAGLRLRGVVPDRERWAALGLLLLYARRWVGPDDAALRGLVAAGALGGALLLWRVSRTPWPGLMTVPAAPAPAPAAASGPGPAHGRGTAAG